MYMTLVRGIVNALSRLDLALFRRDPFYVYFALQQLSICVEYYS